MTVPTVTHLCGGGWWFDGGVVADGNVVVDGGVVADRWVKRWMHE